jgi:DNA-directed RNA polymerase subunit beta'
VAAGQLIDEAVAASIDHAGIEKVRIRSALTCESRRGICAKCYGSQPGDRQLWRAWANRSASSPRSPSASPARSSPCVPSTSAVASSRVQAARRSSPTRRGVRYPTVRAVGEGEDGTSLHGAEQERHRGHLRQAEGRELERHTTVIGAVRSSVADGEKVKKGQPS